MAPAVKQLRAGADFRAESARVAAALACPVLEWESGIRVFNSLANAVGFSLAVRHVEAIPVPPNKTPATLRLTLAFSGDGEGTAAQLSDSD
jgi:hypothetical protein